MSNQTAGSAAKRRGQAVAGALAGVGVFAVLVAVFVGVRSSGAEDPGPAAAAQPVAGESAPPSTTAPEQPDAPASEPAQPEPAQPEPAQPEPAQPEPAQPEPAQPEPAQPEPGQPAPVETPPALAEQPVVKAGKGTLSKLAVTTLVPGTGPAVRKGQTITANYVLVSYRTGELMDSSWQRGEPFRTAIGAGAVIQGWDQGIPGQKVGSRIQLDVPAALAYGPQQGDLRFVVDILAAQ